MTRIRKWVYLARSFAASTGSIVIVDTVGARSAGLGGTAMVGGAEFERLGGVPFCDPRPNIFFRRLRNPLDSLAVCNRCSAISMRGDKKSFRVYLVTSAWNATYGRRSLHGSPTSSFKNDRLPYRLTDLIPFLLHCSRARTQQPKKTSALSLELPRSCPTRPRSPILFFPRKTHR